MRGNFGRYGKAVIALARPIEFSIKFDQLKHLTKTQRAAKYVPSLNNIEASILLKLFCDMQVDI
jgi:hypothetical protein